MKHSRLSFIFIAIAIFAFVILFITQADPFVRSDGFYYFHTAKTLVNEGNFVTSNKPIYWDSEAPWAKTTFNGNYISVTSPGTSLLVYPALLIANLFSKIDLFNNYFIAYNGHTIWDGVFLLLNATLFFFLSIWLIYKSLRILKFSKKISLVSIFGVVISSYLLWYVLLLPIFTHVFEVFFISLLIFSILKLKEESNRKVFLVLIAISFSFLFLIRPVFLLIDLFATIYIISIIGFKKSIRPILNIFLYSIPFILIYFLYNFVSYGQIFTSGYSIARDETFNFSAFHGIDILFSSTKGWFVYSPIMLISIVGFIALIKKNLKFSLFCLASIFSLVITYGFWPNWWGGGSFGSRFLLFSVPFCCIGLAYLIQRFINTKYKKLILAIVTTLTIYSGSILILYRITPSVSDFNLPTYYFENQIQLINSSKSIKDYLIKNVDNIQLGSGFLAIVAGRMDYIIKPTFENEKLSFQIYAPPTISQELPKNITGFLVNKTTREVSKFILVDPVNNLQTIDCRVDCKSIELSTITAIEYSGVTLNDVYDLYLENGHNLQLRGNTKVWDLITGNYSLF